MNDKEITKELGQQLGEVWVVMLAAIKAITKQPGFDTQHFNVEIQRLLDKDPALNGLQKTSLSALLISKQ